MVCHYERRQTKDATKSNTTPTVHFASDDRFNARGTMKPLEIKALPIPLTEQEFKIVERAARQQRKHIQHFASDMLLESSKAILRVKFNDSFAKREQEAEAHYGKLK